jgi:arsenate reductase
MKDLCVLFLSGMLMVASMTSASGDLYPELSLYVAQRTAEFDQIPAERKEVLKKLSAWVGRCLTDGEPVRLTFVCTHNSRRSHFSQIWAQVAASHYRIPKIETYSGGTEATAFNPRTVDALKRCGFQIRVAEASETNPRYAVAFEHPGTPLIGYSKVFNMPPNPTSGYCAIMTCSQADQSCPAVSGCRLRLAIPYDDPKVSDGSAQESATYDERCAQIAREMLYVMSQVSSR